MKKKHQLANRWMRFWSILIDMIVLVTIIGCFANIILWFTKGTTLGYLICGIKNTNEKFKPLEERQKWFRLLTYYPGVMSLVVSIWIAIYFICWFLGLPSGSPIISLLWFAPKLLAPFGSIIGIWALVEIFGPTPNWLEKKLKTRRVQHTGAITWLIVVIVCLFALVSRLAGLIGNT